MVITKEFKDAIIAEINADADFGFLLFKAIMDSASDQIVTSTYLDRALARQSKEFDEKLTRQSKEFDEKLTRQTKEFKEQLAQQTKEFDEKLTRQSRGFDEKLTQHGKEFKEQLARQTDDLKTFFDQKLGRIGSRWGEKVEDNYRRFARQIVSQWGGAVTKWRRKIRTTDERGKEFVHRYEVDIVITNGKVLLVEMKSQCDLDDVERFLENVEQYVSLEAPAQVVEKVILTFDLTTPAREKAEEAGITIIMPE